MPERILAVVGGATLAMLWFAIGEAVAFLLMVEAMSKIDEILRRLWRKEVVPEGAEWVAYAIAAFGVIVSGPTLLLVLPLARQRMRELFRYYSQRWA